MRSQPSFVIDKLISQEFTVIYQESETNDTTAKIQVSVQLITSFSLNKFHFSE
jgi:hypothetical protein